MVGFYYTPEFQQNTTSEMLSRSCSHTHTQHVRTNAAALLESGAVYGQGILIH